MAALTFDIKRNEISPYYAENRYRLEELANDLLIPTFGCTAAQLKEPGQRGIHVAVRTAAFLFLKEQGFLPYHIARVFQMNHATVLHHLSNEAKSNRNSLARAILNAIWQQKQE